MNLFFKVVSRATGKVVVHDTPLATRQEAKKVRDALNVEAGYCPDAKTPEGRKVIASGKNMPFIVTYGPDHWRNQ